MYYYQTEKIILNYDFDAALSRLIQGNKRRPWRDLSQSGYVIVDENTFAVAKPLGKWQLDALKGYGEIKQVVFDDDILHRIEDRA